jgi:hypothetical protein
MILASSTAGTSAAREGGDASGLSHGGQRRDHLPFRWDLWKPGASSTTEPLLVTVTPMVHFKDEGSVFNEPIEKIWRYLNDENAPHNHAAVKGTRTISQQGNVVTQEWEVVNPDGKGTHKESLRFTMNPPKGFKVEYLSGPMKGSWFNQWYTAQGQRTRADVEGNFQIEGVKDEAAVHKAVQGFFDAMFTEDTRNLERYK